MSPNDPRADRARTAMVERRARALLQAGPQAKTRVRMSGAPLPGMHVIGYAYPTSPLAVALGQGRTGCYYVSDGTTRSTTAHATLEACRSHVEVHGTHPTRWSMDHPLNAHCYQEQP